MNWDDVRIFLAVARTGQILAASKRLGLNQPGTPLAVHRFKRPARLGDQLVLF